VINNRDGIVIRFEDPVAFRLLAPGDEVAGDEDDDGHSGAADYAPDEGRHVLRQCLFLGNGIRLIGDVIMDVLVGVLVQRAVVEEYGRGQAIRRQIIGNVIHGLVVIIEQHFGPRGVAGDSGLGDVGQLEEFSDIYRRVDVVVLDHLFAGHAEAGADVSVAPSDHGGREATVRFAYEFGWLALVVGLDDDGFLADGHHLQVEGVGRPAFIFALVHAFVFPGQFFDDHLVALIARIVENEESCHIQMIIECSVAVDLVVSYVVCW